MALRRIVRVGNCAGSCAVLRSPLMRARRTLGEFPLIAEQIFEVVVAPLHRRCGPCAFQPAGDRVATVAVAVRVAPAEALQLDCCAFGFRADVLAWSGSAMCLAEAVSAGYESHGFFVVHGHARERLPDIARRDR